MIFKGFKFGLLLQLAVGPIAFYIFSIAISEGFYQALIGVLGVVIIDALYIILSIIGTTALLNKHERLLKVFGAVILVAFGILMIYDTLKSGNTETLEVQTSSSSSVFVNSLILTGSNPLTIIFWSGVFSSKIIEENFTGRDEMKFAVGAVLSTAIFLALVSIIGQFTSQHVNSEMIMVMNIIVGLILIYFGFRLFFAKKTKPAEERKTD